jgi:hypothetical protein
MLDNFLKKTVNFPGRWKYDRKGILENNRDAPDTVFAGYSANPKAGYPA